MAFKIRKREKSNIHNKPKITLEEKKDKKDKKEEKQDKKKKKRNIIKSCKELIPIRMYDENLEAFKLTEGRYMDIFRIIPKDIANMNDDEISMEIINFIKILKTISMDIKLVSMNFPLNTTRQREIFSLKSEYVEDEVRLKWIDRQIDELKRADSGVLTREFYIFFYADSENDFIKNKEAILKFTASGTLKFTSRLNQSEKENILEKLSNMNSLSLLHSEEERKAEIIEDEKNPDNSMDVSLFEKIQPKGGISFKEPSYITFGDGYVRCLRVYELPPHVHEFWLSQVFNIENSICTIDISTKNINEVKKNINKSISEEQARRMTAQKHDEHYDSSVREEELKALYDEISRFGEVIKFTDFRIFVSSRQLDKLEELCDDIVTSLEANSYKVTALLNEQRAEYMSLFEPFKKNHKRSFSMNGLSLTSEQIAMGFPFDFSQLLDEEGFLLGFTNTGGALIFDPFCKTTSRKHYNSIVCGDMGSGKSTHLKKMFKFMASIGGFVRTFDISGEFRELTKEFGGKIISCNGKEGMLNPLEILKSDEDEQISYSNHIAKIVAFFKCIIPSMSDDLRDELSNELKSFYQRRELTPKEGRKITGRVAKDYPILSEFKEYLEERLQVVHILDSHAETDVATTLNIDRAKMLSQIIRAVDNLIGNYGHLFDGVSTINNISNEKIVTFDISSIKDLGAIFTAQMQNLVSLCWDNAVTVGTEQKDLWDKKEITSSEIIKSLILIDESHRWVNTSMPLILDMIIKYKREARKYFAGIVLASQTIRDFMPEGGDTNHVDKIKSLFELSQYKFMFKQDSSAKKHIANIFGENMSPSQIDRIPFLETGDAILSISGDKSIEFSEWLSKEYEQQLFAGGR